MKFCDRANISGFVRPAVPLEPVSERDGCGSVHDTNFSSQTSAVRDTVLRPRRRNGFNLPDRPFVTLAFFRVTRHAPFLIMCTPIGTPGRGLRRMRMDNNGNARRISY